MIILQLYLLTNMYLIIFPNYDRLLFPVYNVMRIELNPGWTNSMEDLTILLILILILCIFIYFLLSTFKPWKHGKQLGSAKRVMLVISHPDDEVMFFGPTILGLLKVCSKCTFDSALLLKICLTFTIPLVFVSVCENH